MKKRSYGWAGLIAAGLVLCEARAATIVFAPGDAPTVDGAGSTSSPFGGSAENSQPLPNSRSQTIYGNGLFAALSAPAWLTSIAFRPDAFFGTDPSGNPAIYSDVEIRLSTTSVSTANPSSTFADNVGADVTLVHDGELTFPNPPVSCCGSAMPFVWRLTLQTPFLYDPAQGNLVMDIQNVGGMVSGTLPLADAVVDDPLFARIMRPSGGGHLATGIITLGYGLVVEFDFDSTEPTPEPASLALTSAGLLAALLRRKSR